MATGEVDSIEETLAAATAEHEALARRLAELEREEQHALEAGHRRNAALVDERTQTQEQLEVVNGRLAPLQAGRDSALSAAMHLRKGVHMLIRGVLGGIGLLGWLMLATSDLPEGVPFLLFVSQVGVIWWLGDRADRAELLP